MAEEHIKTQVLAAAPAAYGGFWVRFLAYVVDSLLVGVAWFLLTMLAAFAGELFATLFLLIMVVGPFVYFAAMQASARQATYGKALVGLKVSGPDGERISFLRSLGRELAKIISAVPLMVGFLLAAFTSRKQALHDMVASTVVVRDSPGYVVVAVALALVGVAAPFLVMVVFGAAILMAFMGGMMGGMLGDTTVQGPPPKPPAKQVARPAPSKPPAQPQVKPAPPKPAAPVALSPEEERLFGGGVAGMDAPGMTRAGPALLELSSFFPNGPNVWIKVHIPPIGGTGLGRARATVVVKSVTDQSSRDFYDAKSNFEQPFFQAIDLTETKSGVHRLQGIRSVRVAKGTTEAQIHKIEGVLGLAFPLEVHTATFRAADGGKSQKLAGFTVTAARLGGGEATIELEGPPEGLLEVRGYDAKGPLQLESTSSTSSGGKAQRTVKFRGSPQRIEVLASARFAKRDYPFTLLRGQIPAPLAASMAAAPPKPAAPAVAVAKQTPKPPPMVEKPKPAEVAKAPPPPPPPAPVFKAAPPPAAGPVAKTATVQVPIPPGPSVAGPRYNDLMTAVMYQDAAGVEELLAFGKWPDKPDGRGLTPLAAAVMLGDAASAEALLKGGADPGSAWRVMNELNDPAMRALLERYRQR
ncbi:MAG: RDD family protein [Betaproteobacteria bacterium]